MRCGRAGALSHIDHSQEESRMRTRSAPLHRLARWTAGPALLVALMLGLAANIAIAHPIDKVMTPVQCLRNMRKPHANRANSLVIHASPV